MNSLLFLLRFVKLAPAPRGEAQGQGFRLLHVAKSWNTMKMLCVNVCPRMQQRDQMLPNKNRPWTGEDDQKLLALAAAGRSSLVLAAAMKRSKSAVLNRLSTLRVREKDRQNSLSEIRE
jgi:hypothetical protein